MLSLFTGLKAEGELRCLPETREVCLMMMIRDSIDTPIVLGIIWLIKLLSWSTLVILLKLRTINVHLISLRRDMLLCVKLALTLYLQVLKHLYHLCHLAADWVYDSMNRDYLFGLLLMLYIIIDIQLLFLIIIIMRKTHAQENLVLFLLRQSVIAPPK